MEALQEGFDLRLNLILHLCLSHLSNPLFFILLIDPNILASRDELFNFIHAKLVTDVSEVEFISDWVVTVVLHRPVQLVILLL
jgi:hypothetical protein